MCCFRAVLPHQPAAVRSGAGVGVEVPALAHGAGPGLAVVGGVAGLRIAAEGHACWDGDGGTRECGACAGARAEPGAERRLQGQGWARGAWACQGQQLAVDWRPVGGGIGPWRQQVRLPGSSRSSWPQGETLRAGVQRLERRERRRLCQLAAAAPAWQHSEQLATGMGLLPE